MHWGNRIASQLVSYVSCSLLSASLELHKTPTAPLPQLPLPEPLLEFPSFGGKKTANSSFSQHRHANPAESLSWDGCGFRVDLRVGLIKKAWRHPEADSLYVEEVEVGEATPRQV